MQASEHSEGEPQGAEVTDEAYLDDLGFDWTEGVAITDEVVAWALTLDIPGHVTGVDHSRAVSHEHAGGDGVG